MNAKTKKWTGMLGPRQKKAFDKALKAVSWEAKTFIEVVGVVGQDEHRSVLTSPFGQAREDAAPLLEDIGERYEWTATGENYKRIVAELETVRRRLEESRPVVDNRRTPEEESQRIEESNGWAHDREIEGRARAETVRLRVEELRRECPWAKADDGKISRHARAAANIRQELRRAFPGVKFRVRSDSFSMGDSVDVSWIDGPTTAEVEEITGKYQRGSFDGMTDMYEDDRSADSEAVSIVLGQSKYVQCHRRASDETRETLDRLIREKFAQPEDNMAHRVFAASSLPPGAEIIGLEGTGGACQFRAAVKLPEKAAQGATGGAEVQKHHHTKRGIDFWLVVLTEQVDRETFEAIRDRCKASGGWYSRKWGTTPGGFAFADQATAESFAAEL